MGPDDYKGWELIASHDITHDGHWLWYQVAEVEADGYLMLKNCDDGRKQQIANGSGPQFSDDSNWFAYLVGPGRDEADKLREAKKPIITKMVLKDLRSGAEQTYEGVSRFQFLKGGHTLVVDRFPTAPGPGAPSDLLVINLVSLNVLPVANAAGVSGTHDGSHLAVVTKSADDQGLEVIDCSNFLVTPIAFGKHELRDPVWSKDGKSLYWLSGTTSDDHSADFNTLNVVTGVPALPVVKTLDPKDATWLPKGRRISEFGGLDVSDDGSVVGFGVGDWPIKHKPDDKAHPEVWNSKDLRVVPQQRVSAEADRDRTDLFVWRPATSAVQRLSDGWEEQATLMDGSSNAVVVDQKPYLKPNNDGFNYFDISIEDSATGQKSSIAKKIHGPISVSRKGGFVAYYDQKAWWVYNVKAKTAKVVAPSIDFENLEDDHTVPQKFPAGVPTWLADDRGAILPDEFDCYLWRPDGAVTKLTDGKAERTVYRFDDPVGDEDGPRIDQPMFFTMFGKESKQSGFFVTGASGGAGKVLVYADPRVTALRKAKDADRVQFLMGSFTDSANLYVTNTAFSAVKPESHTNPQQAKFYWPKDELISYKSRWGQPLQGFLIYPADYHPDRSYPMVTYIYERLSDNLNTYVGPNPANAYNPQILSQNGYFVFEPDIAYKGNTPGQNAVDCLEPAVQAVLAKHVGVDPDRIGLIGHSWGAYQTAFVTTVSSMFRVGCAGAPLTDLISMYNTPYWNVGIFNAPLLETGQGRLRVPFWEDPKTYIDNSPVWQSMKRKAPILITVGDQDGAVDYHQGIELYNTLRRMGKDCVLLVYYGENHNFTKHADQLDYGHRLRHFLDVYLKSAKPEPWISQGIPFIDREQD